VRSHTIVDEWETAGAGRESADEDERRRPYRTRKTGNRVDSPDIETGGSLGG
jgi:hypothetical protein